MKGLSGAVRAAEGGLEGCRLDGWSGIGGHP